MRRRAFLLLTATAALAGCEYAPFGLGTTPPPFPGAQPSAEAAAAAPVALLLPLTGPRADIGQKMLQAAQLAFAAPGSPVLMPLDTGGTSEGASAAARNAVGQHVGLILGPLTAQETAAAAPVASAASVPMLAFTNDPQVARPGVWTLGITPDQQVRRLVAYGQDNGRSRYAGLLPESAFGHAMGTALTDAVTAVGQPAPDLRYHGSSMGSISAAARALSDYETRYGGIQRQIRAARAEHTAEGRREAEQLSRGAPPPPPFDALLLADTGTALAEVASVLQYYYAAGPSVQIMGPALWADPGSGARHLPGAWFAAPDPAARTEFASAFAARFGGPPPGVADLAYDAAQIARTTAASGYQSAALTAPGGFTGADGPLVLLPDGKTLRGLAVLQVTRDEPQVLAPASVPQPGA